MTSRPVAASMLAMASIAGALAGPPRVQAADLGAPLPPVRIGVSEKICQLIGDVDWETGRPTAARTFTNAGLEAADLGYPVEHDAKLVLLFGDSWPPPHPGGAAGEIPPDDAVGVTVRGVPPTRSDGKCLELTVHHRPGRVKTLTPATIIGPTRVKQGFFNVPSGGVSVAGGLYAFFWTDHCSDPNDLRPSPDDPLIRPAVNRNHDCPETDGRNSLGRSVLARSDDLGRTFSHVVPVPAGFVYATAINTTLLPDLPAGQRLGVLIFGAARYRASVPYLAYAPVATFSDPASWRFFTGRTADGQPRWVTRDVWLHPKAPRSNARPARWTPPGDPEVFTPASDLERCIGELSVTWNRQLGMWLMLYNGPVDIAARVARAPWGPWSAPARILGTGDELGCRMLMTESGCGGRRDFWPKKLGNGKHVAGGLYAPFVLNRYTTAAGGDSVNRRSIIYWLVSTWNPYEVAVMRTTLQVDARSPGPGSRQAQPPAPAVEVKPPVKRDRHR